MLRPRPVPVLTDPELEDLRAGRTAFLVLLVVDSLLAVMLIGSAVTHSQSLWQVSIFILALEALFLVAVFMPMLVYRLARKKENFKLAASRSVLWFTEALGLAV